MWQLDFDTFHIEKKLKNTKDSLFTFLLYPGVVPTNNAAERALRESVIHRKIRGLVRGEKGSQNVWKPDDMYHDMEYAWLQHSR